MLLYKADPDTVARSVAEFAANQNAAAGSRMNRKQRRAADATSRTDRERRHA